MRIAVVTTSFPRHEDDPSGHFVEADALRLAREGHDVHVIAPGGSPFERPKARGPLTIHRAGGGFLFAWPGALARARELPLRALDAGPFALGVRARLRALGSVERLVAHWLVPSAWPLLVGVPGALTAVAHGADVRLLLAAPAPFREHVIGALLARDTHLLFAAAQARDALRDKLPFALAERLAARSHVHPPELDVPDVSARSRALRDELALTPDERLVVVCARLVASKRVELALQVVQPAGLRLVVVGDGPERKGLEALAAELGPRVHFVGALPRREALAWIGAADLLLHPSALEGAPSVVREARALGVPVVACDAGDVAEWAKDDAGLRVAAPDAEALRSAVEAQLSTWRSASKSSTT
jgi:teichuronic acid biosynthesis glycosyltransferase TuaC